VWTAAEKLEQLISETHAQRVDHCDNPAEDILEDDKVKVILDSWKNDYEQWMRPETLDQTWNMTQQQWHQALRKAFRSHLFQMVGSYEIVVFFIVAPFSNDNLLVFRHFADEVTHEQVLERSKHYVRTGRDRMDKDIAVPTLAVLQQHGSDDAQEMIYQAFDERAREIERTGLERWSWCRRW
jgi:hypothetical protein